MTWRFRIALTFLITLGAVVFCKFLIGDSIVTLFEPRGVIASMERDVIIKTFVTMLVLAIPMLVALFIVVWWYSAERGKAVYKPKLSATGRGQLLLWVLPTAIVVSLFGLTWNSAHEVDPLRPIDSHLEPITIQVIALQWKWLFIYPEQGIATVNHLEFPANRPVHFELTADGPVSAFWIPQLGSQIYAMAAMRTQLNLMATDPGEYAGKNTEINGDGYSDMNFTAKSVSDDEFSEWVGQVQQSPEVLDMQTYTTLAKPSTKNAPAVYASVDRSLFETILMKDMMPGM